MAYSKQICSKCESGWHKQCSGYCNHRGRKPCMCGACNVHVGEIAAIAGLRRIIKRIEQDGVEAAEWNPDGGELRTADFYIDILECCLGDK